MTEHGDFPPLSLRAMHAVLWKMIIIEFTLTGLETGRPFKAKAIFPYVFTRMHTRFSAKIHHFRYSHDEALRRGKAPPSVEKINATLHPFACMEGTRVRWHDAWLRKGAEY